MMDFTSHLLSDESLQRAGRRPLGPDTDNISCSYSAFADDDSQAVKKREAAMLLSMAEKHLNDDEDHKNALKMAADALALYRELGDRKAEADSLRVVVHAHRIKADEARWLPECGGESVVEDTLRAAEQLANKELLRFREAGERRGEACMMLSAAEVSFDRLKGSKKPDEAHDLAMKAWAVFRELQDPKLEAVTLLLLSDVHWRRYRPAEMEDAAKDALTILRELGDKKGEGKALHAISLACEQSHRLEDAIDFAMDALALFQQMGSKKHVGFELNHIAALQLDRDRPKEALPLAREAMEIFREIEIGKGWQVVPVCTISQAHIHSDNPAEAVKVMLEALERAQDLGDERAEVLVRAWLAEAHLEANEVEEAGPVAEGGLAICRDINDRRWEAMMLVTFSQVELRKGDAETAVESAQQASALFQDEEDEHQEGVAHYLLAHIHACKSELDAAQQSAEKSRSLFQRVEDQVHEEIALLMLSSVHCMKGQIDQALETAQEALEICQGSGNKRGEANALRAIADIHEANNDMAKALQMTREARKVCDEVKNKRGAAYALHSIAGIHLRSKEAKAAVKAASAAEKILRKEGDKRGQVHMLVLTAQALMEVVNDFSIDISAKAEKHAIEAAQKAIQSAKEAVAVAQQTGDAALEGTALLINADVLLMIGQAQEALKMARAARPFFRQAGDPAGEGQALMTGAHAYLQMDSSKHFAHEAALEAMDIFKECKDEEAEAAALRLLQSLGHGTMVTAGPAADAGAMPGAAVPGAPAAIAASVAVAEGPKAPDPLMVRQQIRNEVQQITGSLEGITDETPLMDSGMDSLSAVQFRNDLARDFGVKMPASLMFDYPTVSALTDKVVEQCTAQGIAWGR